jgi:hypothetical protein
LRLKGLGERALVVDEGEREGEGLGADVGAEAMNVLASLLGSRTTHVDVGEWKWNYGSEREESERTFE